MLIRTLGLFRIKMKLVLCVASLSAMFLLLPGVFSVYATRKRCFSTTERYSKEMLEVKSLVVPKTKAGKCLYECMLRNAGVVKNDALINIQKFMDSLNSLTDSLDDIQKVMDSLKDVTDKDQFLKEGRKIMEKCEDHKSLSGDKCEATGFLLECAVEESKTHGWKPTQILEIIQYIFINNHNHVEQ